MYKISAYYGNDFRGLAESMETENWHEFIDAIWELGQEYNLELDVPDMDSYVRVTPDEVQAAYYEGEFDYKGLINGKYRE